MKLNKIERLYTDNINKFGIDSRAVGWNTKDSQYLRFEKLLNVVKDKSIPFTINELGCGYGELYKYLQNHKYNFSSFNGYDISQAMLDAFRNYINETQRIELFKKSEIQTYADYTITSGIFNTLCGIDRNKWPQHIKETLLNMFKYSDKGMAFNLLTSYVDYEDDNLFYGNPGEYIDFCKKEFSSKVNLYHDYDLYEWTLIVLK